LGAEWKQMPLSELCEFQNGFAFKNSDYVEKNEGTFEIFRMGNILKGGGFNSNANRAFIRQEQAVQLRRFILKEGDILMCMTDMKANTALLGHTAWMPVGGRYLLNQRVGGSRLSGRSY
jgi:type I restriction enzyme S subunit